MVVTQGQKEVAESVIFIPQNTLPTVAEGKVVYDNVAKKVKFYNGTMWVTLAGVGAEIYDDFQDGTISATKWSGWGAGTTEADGLLKITNPVTTETIILERDLRLVPFTNLIFSFGFMASCTSITGAYNCRIQLTDKAANNITIFNCNGTTTVAASVSRGGGEVTIRIEGMTLALITWSRLVSAQAALTGTGTAVCDTTATAQTTNVSAWTQCFIRITMTSSHPASFGMNTVFMNYATPF